MLLSAAQKAVALETVQPEVHPEAAPAVDRKMAPAEDTGQATATGEAKEEGAVAQEGVLGPVWESAPVQGLVVGPVRALALEMEKDLVKAWERGSEADLVSVAVMAPDPEAEVFPEYRSQDAAL